MAHLRAFKSAAHIVFALAVVTFVSKPPETFAQDQKAPPAKAAAKLGDTQAGERTADQPPEKKVPPKGTPRKVAGIPEPTVVLKAGEVPVMSPAEPVYDFGRVRSGEKVTHEFVFSNTGNGPLEILKVKTG